METLLQDVRYGWRVLRKSPGFTLVAVLTLALGIGANTAIFSVVNTVLLQPLSFPEASQLVDVAESNPARGFPSFALSPPNFFDFRDQNHVFSGAAAYLPGSAALTERGDPQQIVAISASPNLFSVLKVQPFLGRSFREEEGERGHDHEVILSHGLWLSRFGGDRNIVGQSAWLDGESYSIVGVMPANFQFPLSGAEVWVPLSFGADVATQRGAHYLNAVARLKPGVTVAEAREDLRNIGERLQLQYPKTNKGWIGMATAYRDSVVGDVRPALLILLAAVGVVVLIACSNIANLLLARANERTHEVAIRTALGAAPHRLVRQFLTESLLIALLGGFAGLILAQLGVQAMVKLGPQDIPRLDSLHIDGKVLAFTGGLAVLTGFIFGLIPSLKVSKSSLNQPLKSGRRTIGHPEGWLRGGLVSAELALSLVLLTGAGLLLRSFQRVISVDPGFDASHVLMFDLSLPEAAYPDGDHVAQFTNGLLDRLRTMPGVRYASTIFPRPLSGNNFSSSFTVKGAPPVPPGEESSLLVRVVGRDYFHALQIPVLRGRAFEGTDHRGSPAVLVLSQRAEKRYFPNGDAIGKELTLGARAGYDKIAGTVVGIVGDVHYLALDAATKADVYALADQAAVSLLSVVVRAEGDPAALIPGVREQVGTADRNLPINDMATLERVVAGSTAQRRFYMLLLGLFAAVAVALAAVGVYGVVAYSVSRRTQEIGVRLALGAQREQVLKMILLQSGRLVIIGLGVGLPVAAGAVHALSSLLFGITAGDPYTFMGTTVLLAFLALLASYLPARRAAKVDPMVALRCE